MVYAINRTLAADNGWNNSALNDAFLHGLSAKIKDQFTLENPDDLDRVMALTNKIESSLRAGLAPTKFEPLSDQSFFGCPLRAVNRL